MSNTTKKTTKKSTRATRAVGQTLFGLIERQLATDYVVEKMLGVEFANMTPEFADKMAAAFAAMQGHPDATNVSVRKRVCDLVAAALEHSKTVRPAEASKGKLLQ